MRSSMLLLYSLVALASLSFLSACANISVPRPGAARISGTADATDRKVMVTLLSTSPFVVRRSIRELSLAYGLRLVASWTMEAVEQQCVVFEVPSGASLDRLLGSLSRDHRIDLAQPVQRFVVQEGLVQEGPVQEGLVAEDTDQGRTSYRRFQHAADLLRLDSAHTLATGRGVRLAVVDTGVDLGHPEFGRRIVEARDFVGRDDESFTRDLHGTAVAGLIASAQSDGLGIVGVAPDVDLLAVKACWSEPAGGRRAVCDSYTLALALDFAVTADAKVINLSLGGPDDPIVRRLVTAALGRGAVVVAARPEGAFQFPASIPGVLAVRSLPRNGDTDVSADAGAGRAEESQMDSLAAPGQEILTTAPGGGYDFWSGSSMSAAQVAGVAALILEHRPDLTSADIGTMLRDTARDNPGHAVVDACAAVARAVGRECL